MSTEFISLVNAHYNRMSVTEKKIADYLKEHGQSACYLSVQELAKTIGVSNSAISRFTKSIGLSGYAEMRLQLKDPASPDSLLDYQTKISKDDSVIDIAKASFQSGIMSLSSTMAVLDEKCMEDAVNLLGVSASCGLFGMGCSSIIVDSAYQKFLRTSLKCHFSHDFHMQLAYADMLTTNDCAIIASHSGKDKEILRIVDILKERDVPIISISGNAASPLAKKSDIFLFAVSEKIDLTSNPVDSNISQLMLINTICMLYKLKIDKFVNIESTTISE